MTDLNSVLNEASNSSDRYSLRLDIWSEGHLSGIACLAKQRGRIESAQKANAKVHKGLQEDLDFLVALRATSQKICFSGMGSESDYSLVPFLALPEDSLQGAPWGSTTGGGHGEASTPCSITDGAVLRHTLQLMGIHSDLHSELTTSEVFQDRSEFLSHMKVTRLRAEDHPEDQDLQGTCEVLERLCMYTSPPYLLLFAGGEELFNPVPLFFLGRSPHGNLLGLVTAVVWT